MKLPKWLSHANTFVQLATFFNGICIALVGYSSISKLLQIQGLAHFIPLTKMGTVATFIMTSIILLLLGNRIGPKRLGTIAYGLACLGPLLITMSIVHRSAWLLMIVYPTYIFFLEVAGACNSTLLAATSSDDEAQEGESSNAIVWSIASSVGFTLSFLLLQFMEFWSGFLWIWTGVAGGMGFLTLLAFRRIPEKNKQKRDKRHEAKTMTRELIDRALDTSRLMLTLMGRYLSCIGYTLAWFMVMSYGVLFIDNTILAGLVPLIMLVVLPFGKWMAAKKLSERWDKKAVIWIGLVTTAFGLGIAGYNPHQPLFLLCSVAISGMGCGIVHNTLWALVRQSTDQYVLQEGASKAESAIAILIASILAAVTGADDRTFWLSGIFFVFTSLVVLPFVKFPPLEEKEK